MGCKADGDSCYAAALPDEPMFVLLARDPSAPMVVELWARLRAYEVECGARPPSDRERVEEALAQAKRMIAWRADNDAAWRK